MPSHTFLARARDSGLGEFLIPSRVLDPYVVFPPWGEVVREARPVSYTCLFEYTHHHEGPQAV